MNNRLRARISGAVVLLAASFANAALAEDMALSIHPHPTLSETEGEAAEIFLGSATHILSKPSKS